ncbi:MAG: YgiQ family radical SAM protein [Bacteroidales bacterium]|nr:YgiQ family radical SAM protein [Bacteroidales bacterium]MBQ1856603.1 YgiQ family radical SAM protein [Bacteroidales bacterium]MBQ2109801.1 YgiQ family radical SAM protein [Bacteroidales bacterium]MBQ3916515.1 YgiQ family radical SAM protein [Bacteroidales bacterium]MBQ3996605.1 YgiQ family radical SAM protein [Bacteroidales bacterium]
MKDDKWYMIPTSAKEVEALGWDYIDVIMFTGDAFIDHPSFGTAVISRWLQKHGYRVAVVPQPNWRDDLRDFRKLGAPRLYFGVNSGAMDSMVNHYTAGKRLRHDDAYTPEGKAGQRPDYAVTVYTKILKQLYPDIPVVIGGIEASLRRLTHYDYWQDKLLPSILVSSGADYLCYGMGERTMLELTKGIEAGRNLHQLHQIKQIGFYMTGKPKVKDAKILHSFEECCEDKKAFAENFHDIEILANMMYPPVIIEPVGDGYVQINPTYPPATQEEMDDFWDIPYTKQPHPRYKGKRIPAFDMIKFSINTHRGCFGGCNFCTIAAHQGKFISSRSEASILKEVEGLKKLPGFAGNISDLGAPTANMYGMRGKNEALCKVCKRQSCLFPAPCKNMNRSHERLLKLYHRVDSIKGIRHSYIGSGIRYDLFLDEKGYVDETSKPYLKELILDHTSGRLKVAPEHTEDKVLYYLGKPTFHLFERLRSEFNQINRDAGRHSEIVPYFISSHPGCEMSDMQKLAKHPALKGLYMDQVQDYTPTPMTTSSVMFYTGLDPRTMKPVFVERDPDKKKRQKSFFFNRK